MKIVRFLLCSVLIVLILTSCGKEATLKSEKSSSYDCVIGIIFYGYSDLDEMLSNVIFKYADYLEDNFNVKIELASTLKMSQLEAVETLCNLGVDVIINASTQAIPDCIAFCEDQQVYWMQIFDMPTDTDIVEKYISSEYYIGSIVSNDENASNIMAKKMLDEGFNRIGLITYPDSLSTSNVHTVRSNAIQNIILNNESSALEFELNTTDVVAGIKSMANQQYQPNGLINTRKSLGFSVAELREIFNSPQLKLAYFDINSNTRDELLNNDTLIVSCGQHSIIGLAFAYSYHYITSENRSEQKLELTSDYITLTDVDEYDQYIKYCVDNMPYSAEELSSIISSLDSDYELIKKYANNYSLTALAGPKSS